MRVLYLLCVVILFSNCKEKFHKTKVLTELENHVWMDSLCHEYHFKDGIISKRLLFQDILPRDVVGKIESDSDIVLAFNEYDDYVNRFYLKRQSQDKLEFKTRDSLLNDYIAFDYIRLVRKDLIETPKLELIELHLKVQPHYLYTGPLELTLSRDKIMKFIRKRGFDFKEETVILSDSTFHQIEQYLGILEFNRYMDRYEFAGFDGANFELEIETNRYTKKIVTTQRAVKGLANLIAFIDYKLQIEKGLSLY